MTQTASNPTGLQARHPYLSLQQYYHVNPPLSTALCVEPPAQHAVQLFPRSFPTEGLTFASLTPPATVQPLQLLAHSVCVTTAPPSPVTTANTNMHYSRSPTSEATTTHTCLEASLPDCAPRGGAEPTLPLRQPRPHALHTQCYLPL